MDATLLAEGVVRPRNPLAVGVGHPGRSECRRREREGGGDVPPEPLSPRLREIHSFHPQISWKSRKRYFQIRALWTFAVSQKDYDKEKNRSC